MSFLQNGLRSLVSTLFRSGPKAEVQSQQVRTKFVKKSQKKDHIKRMCVKHFGEERFRLNTVYRAKVLPPEIKKVAHEAVIALPRNSNFIRTVPRCYATSRGRATIHEFRVSRIVFRHLADYNKLAGVQRAMW